MQVPSAQKIGSHSHDQQRNVSAQAPKRPRRKVQQSAERGEPPAVRQPLEGAGQRGAAGVDSEAPVGRLFGPVGRPGPHGGEPGDGDGREAPAAAALQAPVRRNAQQHRVQLRGRAPQAVLQAPATGAARVLAATRDQPKRPPPAPSAHGARVKRFPRCFVNEDSALAFLGRGGLDDVAVRKHDFGLFRSSPFAKELFGAVLAVRARGRGFF